MSIRFEKICIECLGPLSKCFLLQGLLTNQSVQVLKSLKLTPIETLVLKTSEKLLDNKTTFMLWCCLALRHQITLKEVQDLYKTYNELKDYLISKVLYI